MKYYQQQLKVLLALIAFVMLAFSGNSQDYKFSYMRPSYWRPYDQTGINVFETSKAPDSIKFEGLRTRLGAGFTQQFQNLEHKNPSALNNTTSNRLYPLQSGFMTAQANLFLDVELADGIRLNVTTYLSSRHHNEAWVKGGYIQFDKLPFKGKFWDNLMNITTIKVGHMEINYGDQHFRRSDGGQTLYNPFMDNYIMDGYATEIGGEVYLQKAGFIGMVGLTNGMIKGNVDSTYPSKDNNGDIIDGNTDRNPSIILKGGYDKQINPLLRVRGTVSYYHNSSNAGSGLTLYGGDRTGSNYQNVMEKVPAGTSNPASTSIAFSGRLNPGFSKKIDAVMVNAFIKVAGFEVFGTYENAKGRSKSELTDRKAEQIAIDALYRLGKKENVYAGIRYNTLNARLNGFSNDIKVNRLAFAAGWFVTKNILVKAEIVDQQYKDFPNMDYRAGGKFNGYVLEAVVGF